MTSNYNYTAYDNNRSPAARRIQDIYWKLKANANIAASKIKLQSFSKGNTGNTVDTIG